MYCYFFFFKQKTAYEMRISDWSSDVCSSDLLARSTFRHVIRSYLERGIQWYGSAQALTRLVELNSAIELRDSYEQPTIFLGFHFAAIEATCMYYSILHPRSEEHTSELQSLMRISYAVFCLKKKNTQHNK